jgi:hypothetical protein
VHADCGRRCQQAQGVIMSKSLAAASPTTIPGPARPGEFELSCLWRWISSQMERGLGPLIHGCIHEHHPSSSTGKTPAAEGMTHIVEKASRGNSSPLKGALDA